jgi:hypothetical protein
VLLTQSSTSPRGANLESQWLGCRQVHFPHLFTGESAFPGKHGTSILLPIALSLDVGGIQAVVAVQQEALGNSGLEQQQAGVHPRLAILCVTSEREAEAVTIQHHAIVYSNTNRAGRKCIRNNHTQNECPAAMSLFVRQMYTVIIKPRGSHHGGTIISVGGEATRTQGEGAIVTHAA